MKSAVSKIQPNTVSWVEATHSSGQVVEVRNRQCRIHVHGEEGVYEARLAFSCLLQPVVGDMVSLFRDEKGQLFVTAILERDPSQAERVDMHVSGRLRLSAEQGLQLHTHEAMHIEAKRLHGRVGKVHWISRVLELTGRELSIITGLSRLTCKVRELLTDTLRVSATDSVREIGETETVHAKVYEMKADVLTRMEAPCTLIQGEELVKVDSEQVHIG